MAIFGFGQQDPYAEAEQAAQDRQTAFAGIKDNLPALGLIAGLSMLARNNGSRSVGQLIGQAGGDALGAYSTFQKMQEIKRRQEQLDKERAEEREYNRTQDAWRNDMAERKFGLEQAKMAQDMALARQRIGMEGARLALARQQMGLAASERQAMEEYNKTHRMGADGMPYVMRTGEDGKTYWEQDRDAMIIGKNGEILGVKAPDPAKFADVDKLADDWRNDSKTYMDMQRSAGSLLANAKEGTKTGDLAMVFNFMKALDPHSVVREGEQMQARATGGLADQFIGYIDAIKGQGMLTPSQRAAFVRTARNMMLEESKAQTERNQWYTNKARAYNMDPTHIVQNAYPFQLKDIDDWLASVGLETPQNTGSAQSRAIPGVTGSGGPGGRAAPSSAALPQGFRIVR